MPSFCLLLAFFSPATELFAQGPKTLQPYLAQNKLYALHKPGSWKVAETVETNFFRIRIDSPDGQSAVDFAWVRNTQGVNALRYLLAYRQYLSRTWPDISLSEVCASPDDQRAVALVTFRIGGVKITGKYYFESSPRTLSAQGFYAPESEFASQRVLLLNVMASMAFIKNDNPPEVGEAPQYYRPRMNLRTADDRSLQVKVPLDWDFMAGGGKVVTGARGGAPGFLFTAFEGNPMLPGNHLAKGIIGARYMPPAQALAHVLQGFQHRNVRILASQPDPDSARELAMRIRRQGDAQDVLASWTSSSGLACVGAFKVINATPSMTGLWFTLMAGIWAPEKDTFLFIPALEEIAGSFSIHDEYAKRYILAGLERLRQLQAQTAAAIQDLNRAREQNQREWEDRQRRKEFIDSKWDDYRRGQSYWVSELEGGKVYATDSWGTRDTVTGDYYEGRAYNWTNFEGENPRYRESMREISSYELQQLGAVRR